MSADWKKSLLMPGIIGGGLIGLLGLSMLGYFKDKKIMTKFEKTAVAFIGALCDKIEELQADNDKLRKEAADTVPRKTHVESVDLLHRTISELNSRIEVLQNELEKKPKTKTRKTQEATV